MTVVCIAVASFVISRARVSQRRRECGKVGLGNSVRWVTSYTSYSELRISGRK